MRALRDAACEYADAYGWHVLPLQPRRKPPLGRLVPNGLSQATPDLATIWRWWKAEPQANIGVVARPSGLLVLDVDPRHGGDEDLYELERDLGPLPETVRAKTGGGGEHYVFRHPGGDTVGRLAEGVDVRDRAYIAAAPSVTDGPYAWDLSPDDVDMAELPERWLQRLRPHVGRRDLNVELRVNDDHSDPLRRIPASIYFPKLASRRVGRGGWAQCPFHKGGRERTPSLHVEGTVWACYACQPIGAQHVMGGNIYQLAGLLADLPVPLRGPDFIETQRRLDRVFGVERT